MERMNSEGKIAIGSHVHLRIRPHGEPGIIFGLSKGRAQVTWRDLDITSSHRAERLQSVPFDKHSVFEHRNALPSAVQHQSVAGGAATGILEREREETRECGSTAC